MQPNHSTSSATPAITEPDAADTITLLRSRGLSMAKTHKGDGTIGHYDNALWFTVEERPVSSIQDVAAVLKSIENDPEVCVIRGKLRADWRDRLAEELTKENAERAAKGEKPLVQPGPNHVLRRKALFEDAPHHWLHIDVDKYPHAAALTNTREAIQEYLATLPPEFGGVSYRWQLSGTMGTVQNAGLLKVHVWFWLDRAYTGAQIKAWAEATKAPVDTSIYSTVQANYTAAPVFEQGVVDPVPQRSGFVDLSLLDGDTVELKMPEAINGAKDAIERAKSKSQLTDPREKPGLIGAFHRAFTIEQVVDGLLSEQFERVTDKRLTWLGGSGAPEGAFVRDDRQGIGATHDSWPWGSGTAVNSWDLVRHFKFGHLDHSDDQFEAAILENSAPQHLPSHKAMCEMVKALPEVQAELPDGDPDKVFNGEARHPVALDLAALPENPPPIEFVIPGWMPDDVVTLFAAHGGTGKSFLSVLIALCLAVGRHPFDPTVKIDRRKVLLYSAEDNVKVLQGRLRKYVNMLGIDISELPGWLHVLDATESDNALFTEGEKLDGRTTKRFAWLAQEIETFGATVLIFDNASDALDANENARAHVRQFMSALKRLAPAVLLLAHVDAASSMADSATAKGYSGSTAWNNSARSRWFMYKVPDTDKVMLEMPKANYVKAGGAVEFVWSAVHHAFEPVAIHEGRAKAADQRAVLLELLRVAIVKGKKVSPAKNSPKSTYNSIKDLPGFPFGVTTKAVALEVEEWLAAGLVRKEDTKDDNRNDVQFLVLTDAGRELAATAQAALSKPALTGIAAAGGIVGEGADAPDF